MESLQSNKPKKMDIVPLLFSFRGRIGRTQFSKWWIPLTLFTIPFYNVDQYLGGIVTLILLWPLFALTSKRYHDFNSFGWLGIFQLLPLIGWLIVL